MHLIIYAPRAQSSLAQETVARLRSEGHKAYWRDARCYAGEVERCDRVMTDLDAVRASYEAAGVEVVPLRDLPPAPEDIPAPKHSVKRPRRSRRAS